MSDIVAKVPTASVKSDRWRKRAGDNERLQGLLFIRAFEMIYELRRPNIVFSSHTTDMVGLLRDYRNVVARLIGERPISYLEFGVFSGESMKEMAKRFPSPDARFTGFDSFEGLPDAWEGFEAGHFSTQGKVPLSSDPRVTFVKGWFQDTVPDFLNATRFNSPVLVHFDADLYSSTLFLLCSLWPVIPEYYFMFDEFNPDELIAMNDFVSAYPVEFEFLAAIEGDHTWPSRAFGRITRKTLK